jgi:tetratricopeptide (TPR) repeat protein
MRTNQPPSSVTPVTTELSIPEALGQAYAHWNAGQADQAEMLCQRVLAVWPGQADALHLMGLMAFAYNNLDLAIEHLRRACQAPRTPPTYLSNLAEMLRQKGLLVEAEQAARRALAIDSTLPAIWNNLGIILQEAGKLDESKRCLEKLLMLQPNNAEAHNNLANTCKRLGLLEQARHNWQRALELKPEYPEVFSNLANLHNDLGEYEQALDYGKQAIELSPNLADAYINLAAIETSCNRHTEALRWLDALLTFAPMHIAGLSARGLALMHLDMLDAALASVDSALEYAPDNPEALNTRGLILQNMEQYIQAEQAFTRAAAIEGLVSEKARINLANLQMQNGQTTEAEQTFNEILALNPQSASAWFNRSDMVRFKPEDPSIEKMLKVLNTEQGLGEQDKMLMHFSLGKAYLDVNDSTRAFHHLNTGNALKRKTFSFDSGATHAWLEQIAQSFTQEYIISLQSTDTLNLSRAPIFVLGMPRSGTSLVEQILASHPQVTGAGELKHIQRLVDRLQGYPNTTPALTQGVITQCGQEYLGKIESLKKDRMHLVDKMPANFMHAGLIHMALPGARIIHCRRDPVDTCLSLYSKLFSDEQLFAYSLPELGAFYLSYLALMEHWRSVLPATHFIEIDYESVVQDTEGESRRMLEFLGLPWDPACLAFHKTKRVVRTASTNQVRQPVYQSSSGRWKQHAEHLAPLLEALGHTDA